VVWRQTSESFIRRLENAFRHFGGVLTQLDGQTTDNPLEWLAHRARSVRLNSNCGF